MIPVIVLIIKGFILLSQIWSRRSSFPFTLFYTWRSKCQSVHCVSVVILKLIFVYNCVLQSQTATLICKVDHIDFLFFWFLSYCFLVCLCLTSLFFEDFKLPKIIKVVINVASFFSTPYTNRFLMTWLFTAFAFLCSCFYESLRFCTNKRHFQPFYFCQAAGSWYSWQLQ